MPLFLRALNYSAVPNTLIFNSLSDESAPVSWTRQIAKVKRVGRRAATTSSFFGGAGVSTESGIPDFRSVDGLYNQQYKYPPETVVEPHRFFSGTEPGLTFASTGRKCSRWTRSPTRRTASWPSGSAMGKCRAVVTQNIDGLHQKAGAKEVLELHGSVLRDYCMRCRKPYPTLT